MENDERGMLRSSLRRLLVETDPVKVASGLEEFGWLDLLAADPAEAVAALFETQGETLMASPALNAVMAGPLLATRPDDGDGGPGGVVGVGDWAVAIPGPGSASDRSTAVYALAGAAPPGRCLVVSRHDDEPALAAVELIESATSEIARPIQGIDPELGLVRFDATAGDTRVEIVARGAAVTAGWEEAVAAGRRALAHELIGLSRAMLAMAVEHARERRQFGQPIGAFQAVKHRLAEAKVSLAAVEFTADEAWADPGPLTALLAKVWAGRAARLVGKQAQQVLGGMGFTWEHPFHRHLRRALVLDSLLGSTTELTHELGRSLLAAGQVPRLARL